MFGLAEIHADLSTYRLDDTKLYTHLQGKVARLASEEAFAASPTLSRLLAKEGVGDGTGLSADIQLGAVLRMTLVISLITSCLICRSASKSRSRPSCGFPAGRSSQSAEADVQVSKAWY